MHASHFENLIAGRDMRSDKPDRKKKVKTIPRKKSSDRRLTITSTIYHLAGILYND